MRQLLQVLSFLARRVTHNQLTLLGLSSCLEILVLNLSMFTEPKIRSESSDLPALGAVHGPETAKFLLAAFFLLAVKEGLSDWQEPDLSIHGEVLSRMEKGKAERQKSSTLQ